MAKTYQISNNIIFCVNEDGSITEFATIDENGMIFRLGEKVNYHKNRRTWLYNTYSLNGWGNRNKGHWTSGTYRIEVWYENTCLKSKTFTIY